MKKKVYKLSISYDGTNYCGWQSQPNGNSVQDEIEKALKIILKENISLIGSGRTDAGVHAKEQVAHFSTNAKFSIDRLIFSLNGLLHNDIRINSIEDAEDSFHARYSAIGKTYRYHFSFGTTHSPFNKLYSCHVKENSIDIDLIKKASSYFIGKHDFKSFANESDNKKNTIRTIWQINIKRDDNGFYIEFIGNGFLYKMIRNIVGTLLEVGNKKISIDQVEKILLAKDRRKAKKAAPAKGLFLIKVHYNKDSLKTFSKDS